MVSVRPDLCGQFAASHLPNADWRGGADTGGSGREPSAARVRGLALARVAGMHACMLSQCFCETHISVPCTALKLLYVEPLTQIKRRECLEAAWLNLLQPDGSITQSDPHLLTTALNA